MALTEAYEKYGKFVYVINSLQNVRYYKELLRELNIPTDVVDFRSVRDINPQPLRGISVPIVIDHYSQYELNYTARWWVDSHNLRFE